jgi:hypothetical protein
MSQPPVPGHHREEFRSPTSAPRTTAPVLHSFTSCATLAPDPHPRLRRLLHIPYGIMNTGIHDRDRVHGADFATRIARLGIQSIRTPVRSPLAKRHRGAGCANPAPRVPGSHPAAQRPCPIAVGRVRGLLQPGSPSSIARSGDSGDVSPPVDGEVVSRPVLGGLHHVFERAA